MSVIKTVVLAMLIPSALSLISSVEVTAQTIIQTQQTFPPQQIFVPQQTFVPQQIPQAPILQTAPPVNTSTQLSPPSGQILPASATSPDGQTLPSAQMIPGFLKQQSPSITQPQVSAIQNSVSVPWSQQLLQNVETNHDFGSVPTSSLQEHTFKFINTTDSTLNLISARTSCGCTRPTVLTAVVGPGETAKIHTRFDTMKFRGEKAATVTVGVNRITSHAEYGELQFSVKGKIRKDVVLNPGKISFDNVPAETASQQTVEMKYAGNPLWKILRIESTNPNIEAEAQEIKREGGRITYQLIVKLKDTQPAGAFADELYVITNDKKVNKMPLNVVGRVKPDLEAAPIRLGTVRQGSKITKRFVIRGQSPFEIREVRTDNPKISFTLPTGRKALHLLTYTLDTSAAGDIDSKITVATMTSGELGPTEKTVKFSAQIVPQTITEN